MAAVGGLKTHAPLQTRVGIATGLVVVDDLIGSGVFAFDQRRRSKSSSSSRPTSSVSPLGCIDEAITAVETTQERWWEADVHRIAGEIALLSPKPDAAKAEAYFERALAVARQQRAKSWELRAAMSLARLWRDQGNVRQARDLLASVYGWFTEGFDTRDLKEAKALLGNCQHKR